MSRNLRIRAFGGAAALLVAGVLCAVLVDGDVGAMLAIALIGVGCVALVALGFYEVGLSEDRQRRQDAERRR